MRDPEYFHVKCDHDLIPVSTEPGETNWDAVLRLAGECLGGEIVSTKFDGGDGTVDLYLCTLQIGEGFADAAFTAWRC